VVSSTFLIIIWRTCIHNFLSPGYMSAETGHHFAHPSNKFWKCLHEGSVSYRLCFQKTILTTYPDLTPRRYSPTEDHTLPATCRIGITNLVPRPTAEVCIGFALFQSSLTFSGCRTIHCRASCSCSSSIAQAVYLPASNHRLRRQSDLATSFLPFVSSTSPVYW
jgi:hypothetical protein